MLGPESMMKSDPFVLSRNEYNLTNTTPELLKFQLQEQTRLPPMLSPLLMDAKYNTHLQNVLDSHTLTVEEDRDENDEFLQDGILGVSTPLSEVSEPLRAVAESPNYMNLKVLIENSVFDAAKMLSKSVLSLSKAKQLKMRIADKQEHKEYLQQRLAVANQFCTTLLANGTGIDVDLLVKIFRQNIDLQQQLQAISTDLDGLTERLNNHNMACLVLGYVKDVELSTADVGKDAPIDAVSQQQFDSLFVHIASAAVQKNVQLPENTEDSTLRGKIAWAKKCIDAVVGTAGSGSTTSNSARSGTVSASAGASSRSAPTEDDSVLNDHSFLSAPYGTLTAASQDKILSEYKIALNDLRFSHQFFMKEYEYLKENALKTISEYRRKNIALEKELARGPDSRDSLDAKDREIAQLRRDLALLKVEYLGNNSPHNSIASPRLLGEDENAPAHKQFASMSNGILRKEFKKLVADMQDHYEVELAEERLRRRQLEDRLLQLEL